MGFREKLQRKSIVKLLERYERDLPKVEKAMQQENQLVTRSKLLRGTKELLKFVDSFHDDGKIVLLGELEEMDNPKLFELFTSQIDGLKIGLKEWK